ncbi:hypothetical protein LOTGIDRAFT_159380 [Lottia gigantea]|uniref:Uncharacterized protein n=1 Tax=Lottia gigantea TaxID=225164 RepID=V4AUD1_LOTGI|nr:hypothetical protein LOTGIDRAFT_159380 [Lottia gigantea]ESO97351.1 hypothetical protein LOTGIDRAFT_159380 [Lottia gigantea]
MLLMLEDPMITVGLVSVGIDHLDLSFSLLRRRDLQAGDEGEVVKLNRRRVLGSMREEELSEEIQKLKDKIAIRHTNSSEHNSQLELMRQEIDILTDRKQDLERRVHGLTQDKLSNTCSLEETQERILMLERQSIEKDVLINKQTRELTELQETNLHLQATIDHVTRDKANETNKSDTSQTLFSELSQLSSREKVRTPSTSNGSDQLSLNDSWHRSMSAEMLDDMDDFECDDDIELPGLLAHSTMSPDLDFLPEFPRPNAPGPDMEDDIMRKVVIDVYRQLKRMIAEIRGEDVSGSSSKSSDDESSSRGDKAAQLVGLLGELKDLMDDMQMFPHRRNDMMGLDSRAVAGMEEHIGELQRELDMTHRHLEQNQLDLQLRDEQLEQKNREFSNMAHKLQAQHNQLSLIRAERDKLQNNLVENLTTDDVVQQTRRERDETSQRNIELETELAQCKLEMMNLNNQLLGAIRQKVLLSQELDQWQADMEELLDVQLHKRIQEESDKEEVEVKLEQMSKSKTPGNFFTRNIKKQGNS